MEHESVNKKEDPAFVKLNDRLNRALEDLHRVEGAIRGKVGNISPLKEDGPSGEQEIKELKSEYALGRLRQHTETLEFLNDKLNEIYVHLDKIV